MDELLARFVEDIQPTGDVRADVTSFLVHHGHSKTARHSTRVAARAKALASRFGQDAERAETAGWLHDISAVIPSEQRIRCARHWGLEVLPEEEAAPVIIHQKLSMRVAGEVFGVKDDAVLSAIGCHTTLKANATRLDKIVFLADKIEWDQSGKPAYTEGLLRALEQSLNEAALYYVGYLWERRHTLPAIHPWLRDAYRDLSGTVGAEGYGKRK